MKNIFFVALFALISCTSNTKNDNAQITQVKAVVQSEVQDTLKKVIKSDKEWKKELSEMEYYVLRKAGTERAGTGDLLKNKKEGVYVCRGCNFELFNSDSKFESGTGWPSFYEPIKAGQIHEDTDHKLGYARTEILCARCDGHLGHVFPDGPKPTGLRYCVNSVSLDFVPKEK
jgi:peptide-methionine (R)-S-oxide reductase